MNAENDCTEFTGDRDCVSSVVSLLLVVSSFVDEVPVNDLWLDGGTQLDEKLSVTELRVVEGRDWLNSTDPSDEVLLCL